jgi:hypothetical protein
VAAEKAPAFPYHIGGSVGSIGSEWHMVTQSGMTTVLGGGLVSALTTGGLIAMLEGAIRVGMPSRVG